MGVIYLFNRIAHYRLLRSLSQQKLADLIDCSAQSIHEYEHYYRTPSALRAAELCSALNVKFEDLFSLTPWE